MGNKSFDIIVKRVADALENNGMKRSQVAYDDGGAQSAIFTGRNGSVKVLLDETKKRVELYLSNDLDINPQMLWTLSSSWMFDPGIHGDKEAIGIANDFIDMLRNSTKKKRQYKKNKTDSDGYMDRNFFVKRLINIFPETKKDFEEESLQHENFRYVTFIKNFIVPKISGIFNSQDKTLVKKFSNLMKDAYTNGDKDVRAIVTIVILNSINDISYREKIFDFANEELKKAAEAAYKIKDKKIKPEKTKKRKTLTARMLEASSDLNSR